MIVCVGLPGGHQYLPCFLLAGCFLVTELIHSGCSVQLPSAPNLLLVEKVWKVDLVEAEQEAFEGNSMGLLETRSKTKKQ